MVVYIWCRKNHAVQFFVFGLVPVRAPYLTWVYVTMDVMFENTLVKDIIGIFIGHTIFYLMFVYPKLPLSKGLELLEPPRFL